MNNATVAISLKVGQCGVASILSKADSSQEKRRNSQRVMLTATQRTAFSKTN